MLNPRRVLPHSLIYDRVWGYDFGPTSNALRVYIGYLRRKLEDAGAESEIHTVRGVGYALRDGAGANEPARADGGGRRGAVAIAVLAVASRRTRGCAPSCAGRSTSRCQALRKQVLGGRPGRGGGPGAGGGPPEQNAALAEPTRCRDWTRVWASTSATGPAFGGAARDRHAVYRDGGTCTGLRSARRDPGRRRR